MKGEVFEKKKETVPDDWYDRPVTRDENPSGFIAESSFSVLFPKYREKYVKQVWPAIREAVDKHGIRSELNLVEGKMTVFTSGKAYDPYSIINARDLIKLVSRGVPYEQALKVLEEEYTCDIIKISSNCRKKDKFVRRRDRLVGKDGQTLKALELLTGCYVLVQGHTVASIGSHKGIGQVRSVVTDCMDKNVHPAFSIKTLMIKKELENDPKLKHENWDRFLPKLKKKAVKKKAVKKLKKKKGGDGASVAPTPSKIDIELETGEYFMNERERRRKKLSARRNRQTDKLTTSAKVTERAKTFVPPTEDDDDE